MHAPSLTQSQTDEQHLYKCKRTSKLCLYKGIFSTLSPRATSSMANETSRASVTSSLNLGRVFEIGALIALIESTTAASLVLGNRAAADLLWDNMSIFGALAVLKACVAAATPNWPPETPNVRTKRPTLLLVGVWNSIRKGCRRIRGLLELLPLLVRSVCAEWYMKMLTSRLIPRPRTFPVTKYMRLISAHQAFGKRSDWKFSNARAYSRGVLQRK